MKCINILLVLAFVASVSSFFCNSQCLTNNASCTTDPNVCDALYTPYFTALNVVNPALYILIDNKLAPNINSQNNFKVSQPQQAFICNNTYPLNSLTNVTFFYNFLGVYVSTDYIAKTYAIHDPHYQMVLRFSVTFIGVWAANDSLNVYTNDGISGTNTPVIYNCMTDTSNYTQMLCRNRNGNKVDCIQSYTIVLNHNTTYFHVNFTSLTGVKDADIQYWGLFDLNVIAVKCHASCYTCYGPANTQCTSCALGSFLSGNTCGACVAPKFRLSNSNPNLGGFCVTACPPGYYAISPQCFACATGCITCTGPTTCLLSTTSTEETNLWEQKMPIWLIVIILGALLIIGIICKLCCEKTSVSTTGINEAQQRIISELNETKNQEQQKMTIQQKQEQRHNNIHIEQIDFNDHVMVNHNPRRRGRQQRDMNRSNLNINF